MKRGGRPRSDQRKPRPPSLPVYWRDGDEKRAVQEALRRRGEDFSGWARRLVLKELGIADGTV